MKCLECDMGRDVMIEYNIVSWNEEVSSVCQVSFDPGGNHGLRPHKTKTYLTEVS